MCRNLMWAWKKLVDNKWKVTFDCAVKDMPNLEKFNNRGPYLLSHIQIPCGQCIDCRLQRSRNWADRCMLEQNQYTSNYFVTLTYDPEHLPFAHGVDLITGELIQVGVLQPKDLQDFMKRLRITWQRKFGHDNIRFFACGEYGEAKQRPHYHLIIFNFPISDLKFSHNSKRDKPIYYSEEIEKIWGKGIITVQDVTWETCAYTARYIMKKQTGLGAKDFYKLSGRVPEFVRMSRKPGIGREYYEKNKDNIYATDEIFISTSKRVFKVKPSRYYDKLYDIDSPEEMALIKKQREQTAEFKLQSKLRNTDMDYKELQEVAEQAKDNQLKSLRRNYENRVG